MGKRLFFFSGGGGDYHLTVLNTPLNASTILTEIEVNILSLVVINESQDFLIVVSSIHDDGTVALVCFCDDKVVIFDLLAQGFDCRSCVRRGAVDRMINQYFCTLYSS